MSESPFRCANCRGRHFSTLLEAVQHVMWERGRGRVPVQCCVEGCSKRVRKLRLHIRKFHKELCPLSCSDCPEKFVELNDLNNHLRNGCRRQNIDYIGYRLTTLGSVIAVQHVMSESGTWEGSRRVQCRVEGCSKRSVIETFVGNVGFRDSSAAVNKFITNELQLDDSSRDAVSEIVDQLYKHLQHNLPFSIHNLVKGGSVGKGTAVKDKADIDCVVFLNNVKTMEEHKYNLQTTKDYLESCLNQSRFKDQITFDGQTPFAVKFKIRLDRSSREFNVDLLPTFTTDLRLDQLYEEMIGCATKDRGYYSAHFVSLQLAFVKEQPPIVKNLIRLVKYWRKTCIEDKSTGKTRLPSSYPLELITIAWWENAGKPGSFDIRAGFKAVLQQLVDNRAIRVIWYNYYDRALADKGIKGMSGSGPFVLDPANPTNNVCSASDAEGWKVVSDVAEMTLQRLSH